MNKPDHTVFLGAWKPFFGVWVFCLDRAAKLQIEMLIPDLILGTHYRTEINIMDSDFFIPDLRSWIQQKHKRGAGKKFILDTNV
jgi:hypothetical protein